jgi:uncharacterized membrane protein
VAEPRRIGAVAFGALLVLYPPAVYFGLQYLQPRLFGLLLALLLALRWWTLRHRLQQGAARRLLPVLWAGGACALVALAADSAAALRLLPVAIALISLITFGYTLWRPPSMIERFARVFEPDFPARAVAYARRVTQVWCLFFLLNGSVALYTALYASLAFWTLYNGFIAYVLMGLVFLVEYLVRQRVRRREALS